MDPQQVNSALTRLIPLVGRGAVESDARAGYAAVAQILRDHPGSALGHYLAFGACRRLGQWERGDRHLEEALRLEPDRPELRAIAAETALERGQPEADFRELIEWNERVLPTRRRCAFTGPQWEGSAPRGRTILLHTLRDGWGDALQFLRFAPRLKQRGATVLLICQPGSVRLFARAPGVDRVIADGSPIPVHDGHLSMAELPGRLGIRLGTIPKECPYLTADETTLARWRPAIAAISGFRVGVTWQGSPLHVEDPWRSFALTELAPLAAVPGVRLISLQKGHGSEQLSEPDGRFPVHDLGPEYAAGDDLDTAAIVSQLDLVVGPDTGLIHLGGALGVRTWIALQKPSEWRWMRDREDTPWYPTSRLFRQQTIGDWPGVFRRMAATLGMGRE
jgi:hypothetical protein